MVGGQGLVVSDAAGTKRPIAFGSPMSVAVDAARKAYGEPKAVTTSEECGPGPLQISAFDGLTLASQDGKFVGWWLDASSATPPPTTDAGIGLGSTRGALEKAYPALESYADSSLGDEFTAGGFAGLSDGTGKLAKITHLWAGATCIMR